MAILLDSLQEFLHLSIVYQFYVYGGYCIALAMVFWFVCHYYDFKTEKVEIVSSIDERTPLNVSPLESTATMPLGSSQTSMAISSI
jgi:hypothetical protein